MYEYNRLIIGWCACVNDITEHLLLLNISLFCALYSMTFTFSHCNNLQSEKLSTSKSNFKSSTNNRQRAALTITGNTFINNKNFKVWSPSYTRKWLWVNRRKTLIETERIRQLQAFGEANLWRQSQMPSSNQNRLRQLDNHHPSPRLASSRRYMCRILTFY